MNFLKDVLEQGRRLTVDALHGPAIAHSAPYSPDVPEDLRHWLPDLFDRFPLVLPWARPQTLDPEKHTVWLLDNTAFRSPRKGDARPGLPAVQSSSHAQPTALNGGRVGDASGWEAEFVSCMFVKHSGRDEARVVAELGRILHVDDADIATKKRIAARLEPFIDRVLPNHTVRIAIDGKEAQTLGPSNHSGISSALHALHFPVSASTTLTTTAVPPFGLSCHTSVAEEQGWGVISDIDDTIKITASADALGLLHNTFLVDVPQPVAGMPELYSDLNHVLQTPPFFYLSASPYNLYPFLRRFRDAHYPAGTMILRDASWQNLGGLVASLQQGTREYKVDRMEKIHSWFPYRKFVCVGDSTQTDPEAYGDLARRYPGWIRGIFIRKVSGIAGMDEKVKNSAERFEKAFQGLDGGLWRVFEEPEEVRAKVEELVRSEVGGR